MVLAVVGLCLASGADYAEAAALGNVAGGLEVEKFGVALLTRDEIHQDLIEHQPSEGVKLLDRDRLKAEALRRQRAGQTIGFTNGCFDLLHPGHVRLLREAAGHCDFLAVGLNSDASVKRLKGPSRPINPAEARAEVLSALEAVDAVTIFDEDTPLELISAIRPDVLIKGGDYRPDEVVGKEEVEARVAAWSSCRCLKATPRPAWSIAPPNAMPRPTAARMTHPRTMLAPRRRPLPAHPWNLAATGARSTSSFAARKCVSSHPWNFSATGAKMRSSLFPLLNVLAGNATPSDVPINHLLVMMDVCEADLANPNARDKTPLLAVPGRRGSGRARRSVSDRELAQWFARAIAQPGRGGGAQRGLGDGSQDLAGDQFE